MIVGPIRSCVLFNWHSLPISAPTRSKSSGSKVEARHEALGNTAEGGPSCESSPRQPKSCQPCDKRPRGHYSPEGPSETLRDATFKRGTPGVSQKLLPDSKATFSSRVRASIKDRVHPSLVDGFASRVSSFPASCVSTAIVLMLRYALVQFEEIDDYVCPAQLTKAGKAVLILAFGNQCYGHARDGLSQSAWQADGGRCAMSRAPSARRQADGTDVLVWPELLKSPYNVDQEAFRPAQTEPKRTVDLWTDQSRVDGGDDRLHWPSARQVCPWCLRAMFLPNALQGIMPKDHGGATARCAIRIIDSARPSRCPSGSNLSALSTTGPPWA